MNNRMKIIKNYLYNMSYQLLTIFLPLITIPYISRTLGVVGVGANAYTNAVMSYFLLIANLGINLYGNRTVAYIRDDEEKLSKFFFEIQVLRLLLVFIVGTIYLGFVFLFGGSYKSLFIAQGIAIVATFFDISWLFMGVENFKSIFLRNVFVKLVSVALILLLVKNKHDLLMYVLILMLSTLFGNIIIWPTISKYIKVSRFNVKDLNYKQHIKATMSFFLPQIAIQIFLFSGRTFLGIVDSVNALGYFESADKVIRILLVVITSISTVVMPKMANIYSSGDGNKIPEYLKITFDIISAATFPMLFGIIGIAKPFSGFFFGPAFNGIDKVMQIVVFEIIFIAWSSVTADQYLVATNQMKTYIKSLIFGAIFNVPMNFILISKFGLYGACITAVLTEFVVFIIQLNSVRKKMNVKIWFVNVPKYLLSSLVMLGILMLLNDAWPNTIVSLILKIIVAILVYVILLFLLKPTSLNYINQIWGKKVFK